MNSKDIERVGIYLVSKDGRIFYGKANDDIIRGMIFEFVKFVELDKDKFVDVNVKEVLKDS